MRVEGQCHCGNLSFVLEATRRLQPRACQCRFCRVHDASCASDPAGRATVTVRDEDLLSRYRFARRTADFFVCRRCGCYLGAVIETPRGLFSTLNLNLADGELPTAEPVDYEGESTAERVRRREARWTPTELTSADTPKV